MCMAFSRYLINLLSIYRPSPVIAPREQRTRRAIPIALFVLVGVTFAKWQAGQEYNQVASCSWGKLAHSHQNDGKDYNNEDDQ